MPPHAGTQPNPPHEVILRAPQPEDVPLLYAFESDPAWREMSMVKPRSKETFEAVWAKLFAGWAAGDTRIVQKTILADGEVCGTIGCHPIADRHVIGYGLGRAHWGRGIASRALAQVLLHVPHRPLHAAAAASNTASIRVLEKQGFKIAERRTAPESERCLAREEVIMMLA